ncbi:Alpha/Beta hydrolase protein [Dactylonectria macrodidyma]|uniref:Alpha/Beta hydrolase protein n=1 Tax=Dactylonectria macrodidyma TaxID=307937 RepID=A0A9P9E1A3_9HYPO|nr:Alpha/Beta hydrolase protein [Dactylonectria macrodidyma]
MASTFPPPSQSPERFTLYGGAVVHKWLCDSPQAILILQHGFGEYTERYVSSHSQFIQKLNANGINVWGMDLWGHGDSPGSRGKINVRKAVIDHIQLRHDANEEKLPIFLFGLSLGGLITASSVVSEPGPEKGVILLSPALPEPLPMLGQGAIGLFARLMPGAEVPKARTPIEKLFRDTEQIRLAEADQVMFKGKMSFLLAATALDVGTELWNKLEDWRVPTLVVHGTSDVSAPFQASQRFMDGISSSDNTIHLVEDGYHELLNDAKADEVLQLILKWLEDILLS